MHNLEPAYEDILDGTLALPVDEDVTLQMIDVSDVGRATARVIAAPDEFAGEGVRRGRTHALRDGADPFGGNGD